MLLRQGEAWVLPDRGNYPVRPEKLREMLVGLTELRLVEARTADRAQLDRLGVDDPARPGSTAVLLRILGPQDQPIAELVVGRRRVRTQGNVPETIYVRRPARPRPGWPRGGWRSMPTRSSGSTATSPTSPRTASAACVVRRVGRSRSWCWAAARSRRPSCVSRSRPTRPPWTRWRWTRSARSFEYLTFLDVKAEGAVQGTALGETRFELAEAWR